MVEIPYEGPRFAPKDYRTDAYRLKQELEQQCDDSDRELQDALKQLSALKKWNRRHREQRDDALKELAELREAIRWAIPLISGQPNITEKLAALLPEDVDGGKPMVESPRSDGER